MNYNTFLFDYFKVVADLSNIQGSYCYIVYKKYKYTESVYYRL